VLIVYSTIAEFRPWFYVPWDVCSVVFRFPSTESMSLGGKQPPKADEESLSNLSLRPGHLEFVICGGRILETET